MEILAGFSVSDRPQYPPLNGVSYSVGSSYRRLYADNRKQYTAHKCPVL